MATSSGSFFVNLASGRPAAVSLADREVAVSHLADTGPVKLPTPNYFGLKPVWWFLITAYLREDDPQGAAKPRLLGRRDEPGLPCPFLVT